MQRLARPSQRLIQNLLSIFMGLQKGAPKVRSWISTGNRTASVAPHMSGEHWLGHNDGQRVIPYLEALSNVFVAFASVLLFRLPPKSCGLTDVDVRLCRCPSASQHHPIPSATQAMAEIVRLPSLSSPAVHESGGIGLPGYSSCSIKGDTIILFCWFCIWCLGCLLFRNCLVVNEDHTLNPHLSPYRYLACGMCQDCGSDVRIWMDQ